MQTWLEICENWLAQQYSAILGLSLSQSPIQIRWLAADSLVVGVPKQDASGMVLLDEDIGLMLFLLKYDPLILERQANQALGLRSRLLRESNYSGDTKSSNKEDADGSWRVGVVWLVADVNWQNWQDHILKLRRESGIAEEITLDAIKIEKDDTQNALKMHGLPRLLLNTRSLLKKSATDVENWRSADKQIRIELQNFSQAFTAPNERAFARILEEKAKNFTITITENEMKEARPFRHFRIKNFRNLTQMEIAVEQNEDSKAQAIVLFGPNGTGKSSFAEALSLAAFGTSIRLEKFLQDKDLQKVTTENYLREYLVPLNEDTVKPTFAWDNSAEIPFSLNYTIDNKKRLDGTVLNQEDSIEFTKMSREQLSGNILKGYSTLADHLITWVTQEEYGAKQKKAEFARQYGLNSSIKLSSTAYERLATKLFTEQLKRSPAEFIDWLRFVSKLNSEDSIIATKLLAAWTIQEENRISRLSQIVANLQEKAVQQTQIIHEVQKSIVEFDKLATESQKFKQRMMAQVVTLQEQIDNALIQIDTWGIWLNEKSPTMEHPPENEQFLKNNIDNLFKERTQIEQKGKTYKARLDLLDQAKLFLQNHWASQHPNSCPVCDSDVSDRQGITTVLTTLQTETDSTIKALRVQYVELQKKQQDIEAKLKASGQKICPLATEDRLSLSNLLIPFLPVQNVIEDWLSDPQRREKLKNDLKRMKTIPEAPINYGNAELEATRLAKEFITLTQEADKALEAPQAIEEVKKAFERRLERVLQNHLPSTLGKVWEEICLTLTTASWLLPDRPTFKLEQRGKALTVQAGKSNRIIRYLYNAAECHILGLAWFFTYYFARKRFEEAWILLDDPAQEMDQPSYREFVRFLETILRLHRRAEQPFTIIAALHQEERALDMARATNGKLHILGWKTRQQDTIDPQSVKKVILLAPGFHPLKPDEIFE